MVTAPPALLGFLMTAGTLPAAEWAAETIKKLWRP
jgi:hypothetical protein